MIKITSFLIALGGVFVLAIAQTVVLSTVLSILLLVSQGFGESVKRHALAPKGALHH